MWLCSYGMFEPLNQYERYENTILLHHMAPTRPDLTLSLGMCPIESDSDDEGSSGDCDELSDSEPSDPLHYNPHRNSHDESLKRRRRVGGNERKRGYLGRWKSEQHVRHDAHSSLCRHPLFTRPSVLLVYFHNTDYLGSSYSNTLIVPQPSTRLHPKLGTSICERLDRQDRDVQIKAPSLYQS